MPITRLTDRAAVIAAWEQLPPDEAIAYTRSVLHDACLAERLLAHECDRHEADLNRALIGAEHACRDARLAGQPLPFLRSTLEAALATLVRYEASLEAYRKVEVLFDTVGNVAGEAS